MSSTKAEIYSMNKRNIFSSIIYVKTAQVGVKFTMRNIFKSVYLGKREQSTVGGFRINF